MPDILTVCTGNICRSPLAEHLLRARLQHPLTVESARTQAVVGGRVPRQQARAALEFGVQSILSHSGRQLTPQLVADSALILTATLRHRRQVVRMEPSAALRAFTLREFAWICASVTDRDLLGGSTNPSTSLAEAVDAVHSLRGFVPAPGDARGYDIEDPYGSDDAAYRMAATEVGNAVESIGAYLNRTLSLSAGREPTEVSP